VPQERRIGLEAGVRRFQAQIIADWERLRPAGGVDGDQLRQVAEQVRLRWARGGPAMKRTTDLALPARGLRLRIHEPVTTSPLPVLIYLHGGGWTFFSIDTHDRLMREYAARAEVAVVGVDYSLAPEAVFPEPVEEVADVVRWLRALQSPLCLDSSLLAIGGDSCGANLAVAASLLLRDSGEPVPDALLLNYGAFDTELRDSHDRFGGPEFILTSEEMAGLWRNYLADADPDDPLARPLLADLRGLPPTLLCVGECDILADENSEMADRLEAAGVPVEHRVYEGAIHGFLEAVSVSPLADRALAESSQWLSRQLRR
jgi:acetyl esterase